jgi:F-type H+-transporting ATPase subunit b
MPGINSLAVVAFSGGLLDVSPGLTIWTVVTFIILMVILRSVAWKPLLKVLKEREEFVKDSLEKAEAARTESEKMFEENKVKMEAAEKEAQEIIAQGREYAEKLKSQLLEESKEEARKMVDSAKDEIARKNQEAFSQLKNQIADIAVQAAEKIIKENLDKEKQEKLVNKFIDDITKN